MNTTKPKLYGTFVPAEGLSDLFFNSCHTNYDMLMSFGEQSGYSSIEEAVRCDAGDFCILAFGNEVGNDDVTLDALVADYMGRL